MRIDKFLADKYGSRNKAAQAIEKGLVSVNGKIVASASYEVKDGDKIELLQAEESYVSAGGYKLAKAVKDFNLDIKDKIFADVGASTGGFTDCLLQNGAKKVYCIDVGVSQLSENIDREKVVIIDGFNARNLTADLFAEKLDGAVIDVSFISLTYILGGVSNALGRGAYVVALIKPQFECESRKVGKNGIVRDVKLRLNIIKKIYDFAVSVGLSPKAFTSAPIVKDKNTEYLILLEKGGNYEKIENLLKSVKL